MTVRLFPCISRVMLINISTFADCHDVLDMYLCDDKEWLRLEKRREQTSLQTCRGRDLFQHCTVPVAMKWQWDNFVVMSANFMALCPSCTAVSREAWATMPESSSRPLLATLAQSRTLAHASLETTVDSDSVRKPLICVVASTALNSAAKGVDCMVWQTM